MSLLSTDEPGNVKTLNWSDAELPFIVTRSLEPRNLTLSLFPVMETLSFDPALTLEPSPERPITSFAPLMVILSLDPETETLSLLPSTMIVLLLAVMLPVVLFGSK